VRPGPERKRGKTAALALGRSVRFTRTPCRSPPRGVSRTGSTSTIAIPFVLGLEARTGPEDSRSRAGEFGRFVMYAARAEDAGSSAPLASGRASDIMAQRSTPIWTPTFALLCLTQFSGYAHQALLTPTIPLHVAHLGGSAFVVGVVLAAFALSSVVMRPAAGYWADAWGESGVLAWGCFFMGGSLLLFFVPFAEVAALANALRGIGWAGLNTGGYALLASVAPPGRRAEASGYYSGVQASVSILFPASPWRRRRAGASLS
jgi:hypothetical protein